MSTETPPPLVRFVCFFCSFEWHGQVTDFLLKLGTSGLDPAALDDSIYRRAMKGCAIANDPTQVCVVAM